MPSARGEQAHGVHATEFSIGVFESLRELTVSLQDQKTDDGEKNVRFYLLLEVELRIILHELSVFEREQQRVPHDITDPVLLQLTYILPSLSLEANHERSSKLKDLYFWRKNPRKDQYNVRFIESVNLVSQEQQDLLLMSMETCSKKLSALNVSSIHTRPSGAKDKIMKPLSDAHFRIGDALTSVHEAFNGTLLCKCSEEHAIEARIELCTFQDCIANSSDMIVDAVLGLPQDPTGWKEAVISIVDKSLQNLSGGPSNLSQPDSTSERTISTTRSMPRQKVKELCRSIRVAMSHVSRRLSFEVEDQKLFKTQSLQLSNFSADSLHQPTTLDKVFMSSQLGVREMSKRVLAVVLSYSFFHLFGSPWLTSRWNKHNIVFLKDAKGISMRPFLCQRLGEIGFWAMRQREEEDNNFDDREVKEGDGSDVDPDDMPLHPYPELVMLGTLLIEIYFGSSIEKLAKSYGCNIENNINADYFLAVEVFNLIRSDLSDRYRQAVDACLDPNIGGDAFDLLSHEQTRHLKKVIFNEIVQPLLTDLHKGFSDIVAVGQIDECLPKIDITRYISEDVATTMSIPAPGTSYANIEGTRKPPSNCKDFQIALICALEVEADAVHAIFDHFWDEKSPIYRRAPGDENTYTLGVIGEHDVVLAYMPGKGKSSASAVAAHLRISFPNVSLALVVGVCGGVPISQSKNQKHIYLGDLIVSTALIQYDFGREYPTVFERKDTLEDQPGRPSRKIRGVLAKLKTAKYRQQLEKQITSILNDILKENADMEYPGSNADQICEPSCIHQHHQCPSSRCGTAATFACDAALKATCDDLGCKTAKRVRTRTHPTIHFGKMGSGDTVMRSGERRDALAQKDGIIGFEMEGAGVWDSFPSSIVIKGVCDYADSHKNKDWQSHAAAVAAAGMKALLNEWTADGG